jgi:hypothetical protein
VWCAAGATKQRVLFLLLSSGSRVILCSLHHAAPADERTTGVAVLLSCVSSRTIGCQTAAMLWSALQAPPSCVVFIVLRW